MGISACADDTAEPAWGLKSPAGTGNGKSIEAIEETCGEDHSPPGTNPLGEE
jgi:hypothetical protein